MIKFYATVKDSRYNEFSAIIKAKMMLSQSIRQSSPLPRSTPRFAATLPGTQ